MPQPNNPDAYMAAEEILNAAVDSPKGIRIPFTTRTEAESTRWRCYAARKNRKREELKLGIRKANEWDSLMFPIKEQDGVFYLYVQKSGVLPIEEL